MLLGPEIPDWGCACVFDGNFASALDVEIGAAASTKAKHAAKRANAAAKLQPKSNDQKIQRGMDQRSKQRRKRRIG